LDTRQVQNHLRALGFPIRVDGAWGDQTFRMVRAFQQGFAFRDLLVDGWAAGQTHQALTESVQRGGLASEFFRFAEFKSKGNGDIRVHRELLRGLDEYRRRYGPTSIISGYRDPAYNARTPGAARNSQHVYGNGGDLRPVVSLSAVRNLRRFSGIGVVKSTGKVAHVDVRHVGPNTTGGSPQSPTIWYYR
jgi:peptidoglycan hydrolase-like protein with peptidoglycan-binding domain